MTISEKSAYLKGLMDGLKLDTETNEGKMIAAIVDLLGDMSKRMVDIEDTTIAISDELDEIEEDLDAIEDFILDEDDEDDWDEDYEDYEDDEDYYDPEEDDAEDEEEPEEGFDFGDEDSTIYEVEVPAAMLIDFDEEVLESGSIVCLSAVRLLEFSFEDEKTSNCKVFFPSGGVIRRWGSCQKPERKHLTDEPIYAIISPVMTASRF